MAQTSTQTFNITRTLQKNYFQILAGDDDNDDGDDKDDGGGDSFNQKADDDADDFEEGCLISRKKNFPLRASLNVRNQMSSLRGRHQSMEKTSPTQNGPSRSHSIQKRQWPNVANHLCCTLLTVDSLDACLHQSSAILTTRSFILNFPHAQ